MADDGELRLAIRQVALGDQEALGRLYDLTSGQVYAWVRNHCYPPEKADAVLIATYVDVWKRARSQPVVHPDTPIWIAALAFRQLIDHGHWRPTQFDSETPQPARALDQKRADVQLSLHRTARQRRPPQA